MSEGYKITNNTQFAYKEENSGSEGTAPTDSGSDFVMIRKEGLSLNMEREGIETDYITGTLSKAAPMVGMYGDIGFNVNVYARNSGTLGTLPDWAYLAKHTLGGLHEGTSGTVSASPTPTTTSFTCASDVGTIGSLIQVQIGANYELTRVTGLSSHAYTVFPPLSAAPSTSAVVRVGDSFLLKSEIADFASGSGFFYNAGGTAKMVFSGCKGKSLKLSLEVGQPAMMEFAMQGLSPVYSYAAIGYTPTKQTTVPPCCLGMEAYELFAGTQKTASAVGSVIFASTYGTEIAIGDTLMIDTTGLGVYETKTITGVSGSGTTSVTLTHADFSAVSVGAACYVKRQSTVPIPKLEISIENELLFDTGIQATYGKIRQFVTGRSVKISLSDQIMQSFYDVSARDNLISREIWGKIGNTSGNQIAFCIPKFYVTSASPDPGDGLYKMPVEGFAALQSAGNDEFYMSLL